MNINHYRLVEHNYSSFSAFVGAAQCSMASIAQDGAGGQAEGLLGVWVDDNRRGVSMRLLRWQEVNSEAAWVWRPLRAFPLDRVALEGVNWLADKLRGII